MTGTQAASLARWVRALNAQKSRRSRQVPVLLALTDLDRGVSARCYRGLPFSDSAVIIRSYRENALERRHNHIREAAFCRRHRLNFAISADLESAIMRGAGGLHMPEWALYRHPHWPRQFKQARRGWVSAACHNKTALHRAAQLGVDMVLISPFYPTKSHPDRAALSDAERMTLLKSAAELGVITYALGGVCPQNLVFKEQPHIGGLAGISCFL